MFGIASVLCGAAFSLRFNVFVLAPATAGGLALVVATSGILGYAWPATVTAAVVVAVGLQLGYLAGGIIQSIAAASARSADGARSLVATIEPETPAAAADIYRPSEMPRALMVIEGGLQSRPHSRAGYAKPTRNGGAFDLADALRNDWLELWYEPKIHPRSLALCGVEASIRVRHPGWRGALPLQSSRLRPDTHARTLAEFAVGRALADSIVFVEERRPIEISVSVPLGVVKELDFIRFVRKRLPIDPRFCGLIIALDETDAIGDMGLVASIGGELARHDIRLSVGGLTSTRVLWSRNCDLPFAELGVGAPIVSGCAADGAKHELCRTIVAVGHSCHARGVAAGVQTPDDLAAVRELGFDAAQGSLFGPPLPPQAFVDRYRARVPWRVL